MKMCTYKNYYAANLVIKFFPFPSHTVLISHEMYILNFSLVLEEQITGASSTIIFFPLIPFFKEPKAVA